MSSRRSRVVGLNGGIMCQYYLWSVRTRLDHAPQDFQLETLLFHHNTALMNVSFSVQRIYEKILLHFYITSFLLALLQG